MSQEVGQPPFKYHLLLDVTCGLTVPCTAAFSPHTSATAPTSPGPLLPGLKLP